MRHAIPRTEAVKKCHVAHVRKLLQFAWRPWLIFTFASCGMFAAGTTLAQQSSEAVSRTETLAQQLQSPDPNVRGAAKLELMQAPNPDALPVLLKLAPGAKGDLRTNLIEILSVYRDPRKIPALIQMLRPFEREYWDAALVQLTELGAPAAQALMDSVPDECNWAGDDMEPLAYKSAVGAILNQMGAAGLPALFSGLRSGKPCKQSSASDGLLDNYRRSGHDPPPEPAEEIEQEEVVLLTNAAEDEDPVINGTAYSWMDSLDRTDFTEVDYSNIVEALIATYQAKASPKTMAEIARLLSEVSSPRVARFMRAAVHAPNPEIQEIAVQYAAKHAPKPTAIPRKRVPQTAEQKIQLVQELVNSYDSTNTPKLVTLLSDADPGVRTAAAKGLGELNAAPLDSRDERERDAQHSVPPLMKALTDESAGVRVAAALAVGQVMESRYDVEIDPETSSRLTGLLDDSDLGVVAAAAEALGRVRDPATVPALLRLTNHADEKVKFSAVWALSQMRGEAVTCPLLLLLKDPDRQVRTQAAHGLYNKFEDGQRCPEDVETLVEAAKDRDTRFTALSLLSKLKDPAAVEPLIHEIESYTARSSCRECTVLGAIGDKRAVAPLVKLVQDRKGDVGTEVVNALGQLGDSRATLALTPLLRDSKPAMRTAVIQALFGVSGCGSMDRLRGSLSDEISDVRVAAAEVAGKCKDSESVEPLIRMLQVDLGPAAKALGEIGDMRAADPLIACFKQKQLWGRRFVAHALGQLHEHRAVDLLIAGLHDDTKTSEAGWVSIEAAWALGEIGDPKATAPLQQVVRGAVPNFTSGIADEAAAALKKMGEPVPAREGKL
jgi:HEAT repeat protein